MKPIPGNPSIHRLLLTLCFLFLVISFAISGKELGCSHYHGRLLKEESDTESDSTETSELVANMIPQCITHTSKLASNDTSCATIVHDICLHWCGNDIR